MTLRRKTIAIICITLVGLLLILFAVSQGIMLSSFSRLEVKDTSKNVERAQGALSDDISSLVTMTRDWAAWDDTYNFIDNGNKEYIEANPTDTTFEGLRVNVMLFINSSGQIVYSKAFDLGQEQEVPVPQSLLGLISPESIIVQPPNTESVVSGIILLPEGPLLISSQPILTSQNEGPVRGALIMGRFLDSAEIGRLAQTTRLSLTVQRLDESQMPPDFDVARSSLSGDTPIFVKPLDKNSVAGYALLKDVYGTPAIMLRVDLPRGIYQQGQASQLYLLGSIIGVGLIFGLVILLLLGKSVLSPLSRLSSTVSNIGKTGSLSVRMPAAGKDELSSLSNDINRMLESLERSHNELQESEEKFKHLVEDMNDGYFVVQDLTIVFANARSAEMLRHPVEEVTGRTIENLLPPNEAGKLSELYAKRLRGEAVKQQYETTLTRDDGTTVTVEFGTKRMYYAGKPAVSVVMRDITKRRQMEEALRESEQKYRDVVEQANDLVAIVQDSIVKYVNSRSAEMLGYTPNEMIGTPIAEYVHPSEFQRTFSSYGQRMEGKFAEPVFETALLHRDGSRIDVEANAGVITYMGRPADLVIVRDITERLRDREKLRQSEEHYSTLVKSLTDAVFKLRGKLIIWGNDRVEEIYGYKRDELIGEEATMLVPEGVNHSKFVEEVAVAIDKHGYYRGVYQVKKKDGSLVDTEYTISKIQNTEPIEMIVVARDITERKKTEEALRASEEELKAIFDNAMDGIVLFDAEGKVIRLNRSVLEVGGYDMEYLADKTLDLFNMFTPESIEKMLAAKATLHSGGEVPSFECELTTKSGKKLIVEIHVAPFRKSGELIGSVAVLRDITERKKAEAALRESEERYRELFENANDIIYTHDLAGNFTSINKAGERVTGYTRDEVLAINISSILTPESLEQAHQMIACKVNQGGRTQYELEIITKDEHRLLLEVSTRLIYEGDKPVSVQGIARDITERKRMEKELIRLSDAVRISTDSIVITDLEGKILDANEAAIKLHGANSKSDLIGLNCSAFMSAEEQEKASRGLSRLVEEGHLNEVVQYNFLTKAGKIVPIETNASLMRGKNGEPVGIVAVARDITERRKAEESLRQSEERYRGLFENANDIIFIYDMARNVIAANKAAEYVTGYTREEISNMSIDSILAPDYTQWSREVMEPKVLDGSQMQYELEIIAKDGHQVQLEVNVWLIYEGDKAVAMQGIARDITERKKMEQELRRLSDAVSMSTDSIVITDLEGKILEANEATLNLYGADNKADLIGLSLLDTGVPEEQKRIRANLAKVIEKGSIKNIQYHGLTRDGRKILIETNASLMRNANGEPIGIASVSRDITERKRIEEEIAKSEARYRSLVETTSSGVAIVDLKGQFVLLNEALGRMIGYSPKELMGKNFINLLHPDDRPRLLELFTEALTDQDKHPTIEFRAIHREGHILWLCSSPTALVQGNETIGFSAIIHNITERVQMGNALQESEEKYRLLAENVKDVIWTVDTNLRLTYVSPSITQLTGYNIEEYMAKNWEEMMTSASVELITNVWAKELALEDDEPIDLFRSRTLEVELRRKDLSTFPVEMKATFLRDSDGRPIGILGVTRDITKRKKIEDALKRSEQNYRSLFNSILDGLLVLDAETMTYVLANETAARIAGFDSPQAMIGTKPLAYLQPEERERRYKLINEEVFEKDSHCDHEYHMPNKDGKELRINFVATRIEYQGKMAALISIRDITERKQMEEQLHVAGRLAAVGELAAGVAHELNNPITAIQGFAQFLTARQDLDETIRKDLDTIYRESQRASKITQSLLSFARRHEPEKHLISINEAIEKTMDLRAHTIKLNNIELIVQLAPDLPETLADFHQMQQVFVNLINNAEQAMVEAHGKGKLIVKTQRADNMIQISFADNGPGIPEENMKRIFDPFFTTKEVGKGTGLGLSICYGIVETHGGRIYARSKLGQGATFVVEIPIVSEILVAEAAYKSRV